LNHCGLQGFNVMHKCFNSLARMSIMPVLSKCSGINHTAMLSFFSTK